MQSLSYQNLFRENEREEKQWHFAFIPFEYVFHLLPLICNHKRNTENPKDADVWSCDVLDKLQPSTLIWKLVLFQVLKTSFTGIFFNDLSSGIFTWVDNNGIFIFNFFFHSHAWAWKYTSIEAITTASMIKTSPQTLSVHTLRRRLSWILTHIRSVLDSAANLCLFPAEHKEGLRAFGQHGFHPSTAAVNLYLRAFLF